MTELQRENERGGERGTEATQWTLRRRARDRRREGHRDSSTPVSSPLHPSDGPSLLHTLPRLCSAYVFPIYHRCFDASRDPLNTQCQPARLGLQYVSVFWHDVKAGLFALARPCDFAALTLSSLAQQITLYLALFWMPPLSIVVSNWVEEVACSSRSLKILTRIHIQQQNK